MQHSDARANARPCSCDDAQLAARIADGDARAEAEFVRRTRAPLLARLNAWGAGSGTVGAEDLAHDTIVIVLERLRVGSVSDPTRLWAFTRSTAWKLLRGLRRKEARRMTTANTELVACAPATDAGPLGLAMRAETAVVVHELVSCLPVRRDRDVLRSVLQQDDSASVSRRLAIPPGRLARVAHRARTRARRLARERGLTTTDFGAAPG